jgi:hypothetical protein
MPTDRLLSRKKPVTSVVPICMDSGLADDLSRAKLEEAQATEELRMNPGTPSMIRNLEDKRAAVQAAREAAEPEMVYFTFQSLGRKTFDALVDKHPSTPAQKEEARKNGLDDNLQFNIDTFPIAIITACCIDPDLTEDDVKQLWDSDEWNSAELTSLFNAALSVNQQRRVVRSSRPSSSTASPVASDTPTS